MNLYQNPPRRGCFALAFVYPFFKENAVPAPAGRQAKRGRYGVLDDQAAVCVGAACSVTPSARTTLRIVSYRGFAPGDSAL